MKIFLIKNEKNNTNVVILLRFSDFDEQSRKDNILVSVLNISTKPSKLGSRIESARIMERHKPVICGNISPGMQLYLQIKSKIKFKPGKVYRSKFLVFKFILNQDSLDLSNLSRVNFSEHIFLVLCENVRKLMF